MRDQTNRGVAALSIAGSDSGGGAGIQMDLRTMHRLGVFATTAITAVTAQNLTGVRNVVGISGPAVRAQIDAVLEGFPVAAIKVGMLWCRDLVEVVADVVASCGLPVVVDPVMVATSGARLLDDDAVEAYGHLLEHATVVTPNLDEAAVFAGEPVQADELADTALALRSRLGCDVLLKGGHLAGDPVDVLATEGGCRSWTHARVQGIDTHGSGCMLSAAIAARLARGHALAEACADGLAFVHDALARGTSGTVHAQANVEAARIDRAHLRPT